MSVFAVEADCKRKNGHGRRRARQYGIITKPRQAAALLGFFVLYQLNTAHRSAGLPLDRPAAGFVSEY